MSLVAIQDLALAHRSKSMPEGVSFALGPNEGLLRQDQAVPRVRCAEGKEHPPGSRRQECASENARVLDRRIEPTGQEKTFVDTEPLWAFSVYGRGPRANDSRPSKAASSGKPHGDHE
jgi:hypothetical protein